MYTIFTENLYFIEEDTTYLVLRVSVQVISYDIYATIKTGTQVILEKKYKLLN